MLVLAGLQQQGTFCMGCGWCVSTAAVGVPGAEDKVPFDGNRWGSLQFGTRAVNVQFQGGYKVA